MSKRGASSSKRARSPAARGRDSDGSDSTSSYSYDSYSRSSSYSSSYSDSSSLSSDSATRHRHGRRRFRSRSPILGTDAVLPPRENGVLDDVSYQPSAAYEFRSAAPPAVLGSILGDAVPVSSAPVLALSEEEEDERDPFAVPEGPAGDWACGVCSNINSERRGECYRCGCRFTESLMAMPSYEVSVTQLPPSVPAGVVEAALRQSLPDRCVAHVATDPPKRLAFVQFASVEEATMFLINRRCEVAVAVPGSPESVPVRLSFALTPHPRPSLDEAAAASARAAETAEREKREAALTAANVPRFLWPHSWNPPATFPSAEKHKAFLGAMSAHWDHLSDAQRRYYEGEVKRVLAKAASPPELRDAATHAEPPAPSTGGCGSAAVGVAAPAAAAAAGKTSHALDGLKKRLAERKTALKKAEGSAAAGPLSTSTPGAATPKAAALTGDGGFPAAPACALAEMRLWGGFPVPLQYASLAEVPRTVELTRVPMGVCERLLPPALLQVAKAQFRT